MPKAETNIDLQCTLCLKNPKFSDVSHLLTHISSKSHLAARFKLQIKAQSELDAKEQLDQFDFWYYTSNIDSLLAERLAAKEHKRTKKSRNVGLSSNIAVKQENEQPSAPQSMRSTPFAETPAQGFRGPVPRMHLWPAATDNTSLGEWEASPVYATPTTRREVPYYPSQETPSPVKLDPELTTPWKPEPEDGFAQLDKPGEKLTDSAKLKGIIWPGMDLFDSATPELKRMRNQKKDGSILEQMMATSRGVEPAEVSYHSNGEFRTSRDIFGPLSTENSPELPTPKKRKARKTTATLSNVSVNAPRMRASRGKKAAAAGNPQKRQAPPMLAPPPPFLKPAPTLNPLTAGFGRRYIPTAEEDEEFRLTVEDMGRKRTFNIFQDIPEVSPARTETPLEDHRYVWHAPSYMDNSLPSWTDFPYPSFDFPTHGMATYPNEPSTSSRFPASPTPATKPASYRSLGKENGQPELPAQQQARRGPPAPSHIYPPHMFHDPSSINPLYNHAYARSFGGFAHHTYTVTNVPSGYGASFQGDFKPVNPMARPQQPQGQGMGSQSNGFGDGMHYNM